MEITTLSTDDPAETWAKVTEALKAHDTGKVRIRFSLNDLDFESERTAAVLYGGMLIHKEDIEKEGADEYWTPEQEGIAWGVIITGAGSLVPDDHITNEYDPVEHVLETLQLELV